MLQEDKPQNLNEVVEQPEEHNIETSDKGSDEQEMNS